MLRYALALSLGIAALGLAYAADAVTIKGTITCAKCDLGKTDKCATVIKDGDKIYFFDAAGNKANHGKVCKSAKEGEVTGTVKKDGDKDVITVTKVTFK
jgi:hypothetical protein